MNTKTRAIVVGAVVVLIALAIWKGAGSRTADNPSPSDSSGPVASATPLVVSYDASTSGWSTYTSASAGFAISYPPELTPVPCGSKCIAWSTKDKLDEPIMGISIVPGTMTDVIAEAQAYIVDTKTVKVGSLTWTHATLQAPESPIVITTHLIQHGGNVFEFGTDQTDATAIARYGAMIRSFRFTK